MKPTVAVIVPTYNRAHCVGEAIESVLDQTVPADEIIVVDDGSTDNTPEVLAGFGDRIIVIRQANRGVSAARNAGIARATSEWITFLDSDDVWYPNRVFVLHRDVVQSGCGVHVANFEITGEGYHKNVFQLNNLAMPKDGVKKCGDGVTISRRVFMPIGLAVRRDLLIDAGGFDEGISFAEDLDLAIRLTFSAPWLVSADVVGKLRRLDEAVTPLSAVRGLSKAKGLEKIIRTCSGIVHTTNLDDKIKNQFQTYLSYKRFEYAEQLFCAGSRRRAIRELFLSAKQGAGIKAWLKIIPPLLLSQSGFRALRLVSGRAFSRQG